MDSPCHEQEMGIGTAGNESCHLEIGNIGQTIHRQRRHILRFKLRAFLLAKMASQVAEVSEVPASQSDVQWNRARRNSRRF